MHPARAGRGARDLAARRRAGQPTQLAGDRCHEAGAEPAKARPAQPGEAHGGGVEPERSDADDRLRLILTCCHPALSREAQVGLTLRAVCGFTTAQIARAFLAPEATVAQRLVRAKHKIASAGIPYRIPSGSELNERLAEVLAVLYLLFNEGHLSTRGSSSFQRDPAEGAAWVGAL